MNFDPSDKILALETAADSHSETNTESIVIAFVIGGLFLGALFREVHKKTGFPYNPMIFTIGILLGIQTRYFGVFAEIFVSISEIDPREMLLIFLPTLVFAASYNIDWHLFKRQLFQITILSGPCVLVTASLIAISLKVVLNYSDEYYTWASAFMFGSILSCTDTRAVLSELKEKGASKRFCSLIEGESLLNDGSCMVLLIISSQIVLGTPFSVMQTGSLYLQLTLGGIILGILAGIISVFWIRRIFNNDVMVTNVTFVTCYIVYYFAENIDIGIRASGIVALISLGLFMAAFGKSRFGSESAHSVKVVWEYAAFCAETLIFLMAGIIIGFRVFLRKYEGDSIPVSSEDFIKLFGLYVCMMLARYIGIIVFMPLLKKHGYGLTADEAFVLSYGGIRGAIGICFALVIGRDHLYDPTLRHFMLFDMAGCAVLTVLINGSTIGFFIKRRNIINLDIIKQKVFVSNIENLINKIKEYKRDITILPDLSEVDWSKLDEFIGIPAYEKLMRQRLEKIGEMEKDEKKSIELNPLKLFVQSSEKEQELLEKGEDGYFNLSSDGKIDESSDIDEDLEERLVTEARNRFIKSLQKEYYRLFRTNQCSPDAYLVLKESANWDLDNVGDEMSSWDYVSTHFTNTTTTGILFFLKRVPFVGNLAKKNLSNHIFFVYDVVLNYLNAHDATEKIAVSFPFSEDIISTVLEESEENKGMAESYFKNYLNISFPEINKFIQVKKAATWVLNNQKTNILTSWTQGQLEEKEYQLLKGYVDDSLIGVTENYGSWDRPPMKEFLKQIPFFQFFTEDEIDDLLSDMIEKPFHKDEFIIKEGAKAEYLYIITRGVATESCKSSSNSFKEKKDVSSIVSCHEIISGFRRYQASCIADSLVYAVRLNLKKVKRMIKGRNKVSEFLWKESFYFLTRFYNEELDMFANLHPDILNEITNLFVFKKYKPNTRIDLKKGGIFLKGQAKEITESLPTLANLNDETEDEKPYSATVYQTLAYIPPSKSKFLLTDKYSWVFHFVNFERMTDLISRGIAEKERSRSRSFLGCHAKNEVPPKSGFSQTRAMTPRSFALNDFETEEKISPSD